MGDLGSRLWITIKNYYIAFISGIFVGGSIWMLLDVSVTKGIDASFVSAVMDSIMAGTAILAVLAAKNYMEQFTAQEGFKLAFSLVNEEMLSITKHANVLMDYLNLQQKIKDYDGQVAITDLSNNLTIAQKKLKNSLSELDRLYNGMIEKKRKLDTYGIDAHKLKVEYYSNMIENLGAFIRECKDLDVKVNTIIEKIILFSGKNLYQHSKIVFTVSSFKFDEPISDPEVVRQYWLNAIQSYELFRKDGRRITNLFQVR
ncbi:hypothetical protein [Kluyvera georgiana]|uniref:hypothetical protein n=1 Tax=Kluyvera georgiana TaxID=73098 RepID=UPI0013DD1169|nr:hypothetical protein [Kluyvera georgiana]